jgi:plasmid replication initiation protein
MMQAIIEMQPDRQALVVRHNYLIESRHRLSVVERRFLLWIISQIKPDDDSFETYRISVTDWADFVGITKRGDIYKDVADMANSFTTRNIAIRRENEKKERFFNWFHHIEYDWGTGTISARIHEDLRPYLLQLKEQFTAITLEYALVLKSFYAGRLYDLLMQYRLIGVRIIELPQLKSWLGVDDDKYDNFAFFRRRVLDIAEREINDKTDIRFSWEAIKNGRKVVAIKFVIVSNVPAVTVENPEESDEVGGKLFARLQKHGVKAKQARQLVGEYDNAVVDWALKEFERKKRKKEKIGAGWLVNAIKEDWRPNKSLFDQEEEARRDTIAQQRAERERVQEEMEALSRAFSRRNFKRVHERLLAMDDETRAPCDERFFEKCSGFLSTYADRFREQGFENPSVLPIYYDANYEYLLTSDDLDFESFVHSQKVSELTLEALRKQEKIS